MWEARRGGTYRSDSGFEIVPAMMKNCPAMVGKQALSECYVGPTRLLQENERKKLASNPNDIEGYPRICTGVIGTST